VATLKIDASCRRALYDVDATRLIEQSAASALPGGTLMQRAGLAVARLAMALAPHSQRIWIACGSGNNGGDGLAAAVHLQRWGKAPIVTWLGQAQTAPHDAANSYRKAREAEVSFSETPPDDCDLCIDALLGIGTKVSQSSSRLSTWMDAINAHRGRVLAVDLPSGLLANTGVAAPHSVMADHTLCLLTLKPGLFTAQGRDRAGTVWLDDLGIDKNTCASALAPAPTAWLASAVAEEVRQHDTHKGSYGDVAVVGGTTGMTGACLLAAAGALHAGAGRVYVCLLDTGSLHVDVGQPELMLRAVDTLDLRAMTIVCGCGGGDEIREPLPKILAKSANLVIDADALNALARDTQLQAQLVARGRRNAPTVITPHPLEAARLLGTSVTQVQGDRLAACQELALRFNCTVVLKGSGTVITAPNQIPVINPTGNARLASAGSGDVLAGMIGARLATGLAAPGAASQAVYRHGLTADLWNTRQTLTAGALARAVTF
jgi:hydroxyethylthiazole kinase-like uncharacterized protein yjeF